MHHLGRVAFVTIPDFEAQDTWFLHSRFENLNQEAARISITPGDAFILTPYCSRVVWRLGYIRASLSAEPMTPR
jgi:hypothetical protein